MNHGGLRLDAGDEIEQLGEKGNGPREVVDAERLGACCARPRQAALSEF